METPTILQVARKIVQLYGRDDKLTPLKLQKLAYYCQAWSLVWEEKPMFPEDFQAWANGPVNPDLYQKHKGTYIIDDSFLSEASGFKFSDTDIKNMQSVLGYYGNKEPFYLSELTHKELPWKLARGTTPPGEPSTAIITKDSMQEYYSGIASV